MKRDDGGPAFPRTDELLPGLSKSGMSLRDWIATHAPEVPAWFEHPNVPHADDSQISSRIKRMIVWRWHYADAMLAERAKEEPKP